MHAWAIVVWSLWDKTGRSLPNGPLHDPAAAAGPTPHQKPNIIGPSPEILSIGPLVSLSGSSKPGELSTCKPAKVSRSDVRVRGKAA
jgi:hypothetical protein